MGSSGLSSRNGTEPDSKEAFALELASRSKGVITFELLSVLFLGMIGLIGNFLICVTIYKAPSLRTISNWYIASLSFINLLISVSILFFLPTVALSGRWVFNDGVCQFQGFTTAMLATTSIYAMALVAINRYFIMVRSNLHRKYFTKRNVWLSIVVSWVMGANFPLSYFLQCGRFEFHPGKAICVFDITKLQIPHAILSGLSNVQIPYIIIFLCYVRIYKKVKRHSASLKRSTKAANYQISPNDIRITKILFAIVLSFTMCWSPFFVIECLGIAYGPYFAPRSVYVLYSFMAGSSPAISSILYGGFNREVKEEIIKLLRTCQCRLSRRAKVNPRAENGRVIC